MKKNLSSADRIIRILIALVIAGLYFANQISGIAAIILLVIAGVFVLTSFISYCPIYGIFGMSSRKKTSTAK